jgi:hypothetical protein
LKVLTGAAIAFGLIEGGAQAAAITVTDLAREILRPKEEGVDHVARREAVLKPRVFGEFLRNYDEHPFPRQDIALNRLGGHGRFLVIRQLRFLSVFRRAPPQSDFLRR